MKPARSNVIVLVAAAPRFCRLEHSLPGMVYADSVKYRVSGAQAVYWQQLTGELISAFAGVGLVSVVYSMALAVTGRLGALLSAFSVTAITESRIPAPDSSMVLLMGAALLLLRRQRYSQNARTTIHAPSQ